MAIDIGVSLQLEHLAEVEAWLAANAKGRKYDQVVKRYTDGPHVYHRHVVQFEDDIMAFEFKFEMSHVILPAMPEQPVVVPTPTMFIVKQEHWREAMGWVIANVTGVDWSVSQSSYQVDGEFHMAQLFIIKDETLAALFKLANAQYIAETR
jgi:hypothetical protein